MKNLVSRSVAFAALIALMSGHVAVGQDDVQPLIDTEPEVKSVLQPASAETATTEGSSSEATASEDIPPPVPVPDASLPAPQAAPAAVSTPPRSVGGEARAYDFGISYVPTDQGLLVKGVLVDSVAAATGVRPNDMIVGVNGDAARGELLAGGQAETLDVVRNGVRTTLNVVTTPQRGSGASYVPQNRQPYSVPRSTAPSQVQSPTTTYRVPSQTYVEPRRRYSSVYEYTPGRAYPGPYSYRRYYGSSRPGFSIGYGSGIGIVPGYGAYPGYGYGPGLGFGPGIGYGRGVGIGYGRGYGRSGVSIRIGF